MAILVIRQGYNEGSMFRLGQRTLTMGRDKGNMVQVIDDKVSRRHALIRWSNNGYQLVDLQSSNGVYLNDERVREASLSLHDRIRVGGTVLELIAEMHISEDAALGRKVVDRAIIDKATRSFPAMADSSPGPGNTVETGELLADRDLLIHKFVYELSLVVSRGKPLEDCLAVAARGIKELVMPDRLLVLKLTGDNQARRLLADFADGLPAERKRERAYMPGLARAVREKQPLLLNELPHEQGRSVALGSMLAVPIVSDAGACVGALYLDSFADNRKPYIDDDREVLSRVSRVLRNSLD